MIAATSAPAALSRHLPRIVLTDCPYCVRGRKRYVCAGRTVDQPCAHCAGRGTIVTDDATQVIA